MSKPLPVLLPFEEQPVRSVIISAKLKTVKVEPEVIPETRIREQQHRITELEQQLSDLQFRYDHIQNLLSDTDRIVESQQREITVLKHALSQQQFTGSAQQIEHLQSTILQLKQEITALQNQNVVLLERLAKPNKPETTVEVDVDTQTASKIKQVIDSPRLVHTVSPDLRLATKSPQVAGLPTISTRSTSPTKSRPSSPIQRLASISSPNLNYAYQYHDPNKSPKIPDLQSIPSLGSLKEQLSAIGSLLDEPANKSALGSLLDEPTTEKSVVDHIFRSPSKEFVVETTVPNSNGKRPQVRVLEPGEEQGMGQSIASSQSATFKRSQSDLLKDRLRHSKSPQWVQPSSINDLSRSPSPSKSMLLRERDELEEELLAQYGRLRKLESMESILKSLTKAKT